jgi:hypothetical protein
MTSCAPDLIIGTTPVFELTFYDGDGELAGPSSITVVHREPNGDETTYTDAGSQLVESSVGVWVITLPATDQVGNHLLVAEGTGGFGVSVRKHRFQVKGDGVDAI